MVDDRQSAQLSADRDDDHVKAKRDLSTYPAPHAHQRGRVRRSAADSASGWPRSIIRSWLPSMSNRVFCGEQGCESVWFAGLWGRLRSSGVEAVPQHEVRLRRPRRRCRGWGA